MRTKSSFNNSRFLHFVLSYLITSTFITIIYDDTYHGCVMNKVMTLVILAMLVLVLLEVTVLEFSHRDVYAQVCAQTQCPHDTSGQMLQLLYL
jgi:hypothetical protein